jgi:hypothetical protein
VNGVTNKQTFRHRDLIIDCALFLITIVIGLSLFEPGIFTVDESHYLLAIKALADDGSHVIDNGYHASLDPALLYFYTVVPDKLTQMGTVASVPFYHALLATPFYWLAGLAGVIFLNILSFCLTLIAVRRLARLIIKEGNFDIIATIIFALASYSFEYAFGIWPHALSQALVTWSILLATRSSRHITWPIIMSGLLAGIATGVRLQNIVLLPIIMFATATILRVSIKLLGLHLSGWLLPLLGMAWVNLYRFNSFNPLTYGNAQHLGHAFSAKVFIYGGLLLIFAIGLLFFTLRLWNKTKNRKIWFGFGLLSLVGTIILSKFGLFAQPWLLSSGFHLIDTSLVANAQGSIGAQINDLGQLLYGGVLKKGLLEAMPYVVLSLLLVTAVFKKINLPKEILFLSIFGLYGLLFIPLVISRGGLCFNPRYLLELLPMLVLVSVYWGYRFLSSRLAIILGAILGIAISAPILANPGSVEVPAGGYWPMLAPLSLSLALLLVGMLAASTLTRQEATATSTPLPPAGEGSYDTNVTFGVRVTKFMATGLLSTAIAYSALIHFGIDIRSSLQIRYFASRIAKVGDQFIAQPPEKSVLFTWDSRKDIFTPLKLERDIWIASLNDQTNRLPDLGSSSPDKRRIYILKNGIPEDRFQKWTAPFDKHYHRQSGLEFVELTQK